MRNLWGKDKIQATLESLDRLTKVEGLSAGAQTLGVVHGLAEGARYFRYFLQIFVNILILLDGKAQADGIRQASNKLNKMKRLLLFTPPLPAVTDSIL